MADDIRTRLSEALDENQREIEGRSGARVVVLRFRGEWRTVERPVAEALVERDRQLLADVAIVEEQQREHSAKLVEAWRPRGDEASIPRMQEHAERIAGRLDALMAEVERSAAFWLGEGSP